MSYTTPVEPDEVIFTVEAFRKRCETGGFIDYDGFGEPAKEGLSDPDIWIKPSDLSLIPADATHIVWYNR